MKQQAENQCDHCRQHKAVLYCRADAAKLCISCDSHVHKANAVSLKHPRSLLCNSCASASSSIYCSTHDEVYCSTCDFEAHVSVFHRERRAVEPFYGCPSAIELGLLLGFGGDEDLLKEKDEFFNEDSLGFWDSPPVVRLNDLVVALSSNDDFVDQGFQVLDVPPLPKDRNLATGKHKDEISIQLRQLIKSENQLSSTIEDFELGTEFASQLPNNNDKHDNDFYSAVDGNAKYSFTPESEASKIQWNNNDWQEATDPAIYPFDQLLGNFSANESTLQEKFANFQASTYTPDISNGDTMHIMVTSKVGLEFFCPDRNSALSRYKEKRKARRYDKLIRYESRKVRADSRVRIKGRFVKVDRVTKS